MMAYWLSHALHDGSCSLSNHHFPNERSGCIVSIVLDGNAGLHFSAIRISIVFKESGNLNNLNIFESFDPGKHLHPKLVSNAAYRSRLYHRTTLQRNEISHATSDAHICTIVFEVINTRNNNSDSIALQILPLTPPPNISNLRVVYHRVHSCNPANPSLLIFLKSNYLFAPVPNKFWTTFYPLGVPVHSVRIVPTTAYRKIFPLFQPLIVLRIVNFAIGEKPPGWRKALLDYALTCKSWAHVLSLFYERFDGTYDGDKADVVAVAHSLQAKPEYGQLMPKLQYTDFSFKIRSDDLESGLRGWIAFLDIMRYATSVTDVSLASFPRSIVGRLVLGLSDLRKVRQCLVVQNNDALAMADIQSFVTNWKELRKLEVRGWAQKNDFETTTSYLDCNIEDLVLRFGTISGSQLLRFASPTGCRLTWFNLENVHGVSNHDFYLFLLTAAATLREIIIYDCPMHRVSPDEELALDAVMPMMQSLELLEAPYVSVLTLSRKSAVTQVPGVNNISSIMVSPVGDNMSLRQVATAMEVTGWDMISLLWRGALDWDMSAVEAAVETGRKRNVKLNCWNEFSEHS